MNDDDPRSRITTCHRLLVEPLVQEPGSRRELVELEVPAGVRRIGLDGPASHRRHVREEPAGSGRAFGVEAIEFERGAGLLLFSPAHAVRLNGLPAPLVTVLEVGDRIDIGGVVAHVSRRLDVEVGPPSAAVVGRPCALCRTQIAATTTVFRHGCGALLHAEPSSKPEGDRLECVRLTRECVACGEALHIEGDLEWTPEP